MDAESRQHSSQTQEYLVIVALMENAASLVDAFILGSITACHDHEHKHQIRRHIEPEPRDLTFDLITVTSQS